MGISWGTLGSILRRFWVVSETGEKGLLCISFKIIPSFRCRCLSVKNWKNIPRNANWKKFVLAFQFVSKYEPLKLFMECELINYDN